MKSTLRRRIAAVAVTAVGVGLLQAVPASAADLFSKIASVNFTDASSASTNLTKTNTFTVAVDSAAATTDSLSVSLSIEKISAEAGVTASAVFAGTAPGWTDSALGQTDTYAPLTAQTGAFVTSADTVTVTANSIDSVSVWRVKVTAVGSNSSKKAFWTVTFGSATPTINAYPFASDKDVEGIVAASAVTTVPGTTTSPEYNTVTQQAGPFNYVLIPAVANTDLSLVVTGATLTPATFAFRNSTKLSGSVTYVPSKTYLLGDCLDAAGVLADNPDLGLVYNAGDCVSALSDGAFIKVPTTDAGTSTVTVWSKETTDGVVTVTPLQVYTIVVGAAASVVYSYTTFDKSKTGRTGDYSLSSRTTTVYAPKTVSTSGVGAVDFTWQQKNTDNTNLKPADSKAVTVSLTGVGSLDNPVTAVGSVTFRAFAAGTTAAAAGSITVYSDGRAGSATVAIAVDGVVGKTWTVKFYGAPAKVDVSANYTVGRSGGYTKFADWEPVDPMDATCAGGDTTPAIVISVLDADGTLIPSAAASAVMTSSNTAAVVPTAGVAYTGCYGFLGVGFGQRAYGIKSASASVSGDKATLTWTVTNLDGSKATGTQAVTLGGSVAKVVMAFDKGSYTQGSLAKVNVTATDSAGNPVYDGAAWFTTLTSNLAYIVKDATLWTSTLGGKASAELYAPTVAGTWTLSGTDGSAAENAINASATVSSAADVDAIKAQVVSITATVTALQTAMAALVASVTATLTTLTAKINKIMKKLRIK